MNDIEAFWKRFLMDRHLAKDTRYQEEIKGKTHRSVITVL